MHSDEWFDSCVEAFVDQELSDEDRRSFEDRLAIDPILKRKTDLARQIAQSLRDLPGFEMPPSILTAVNSQIEKTDTAASINTTRTPLRLVRPSRKIVWASIAAAAVIVVAINILPAGLPDGGSGTDQPSQAEVDRALEEVKWTLALVSDIGNERQQIVNGHIVQPVQRAMSFVLNDESNKQNIQ